jgi:myo-inositol-1(or 4)-monophosphatase
LTTRDHDAYDLLAVAQEAVELARRLVLSRPVGDVFLKGDRDLQSDVDLIVEREVKALLRDRTPEIGFLGEEEGGKISERPVWILDPIDGTVNFLHGVPLCAVSLSLVSHETRVAVIDLPFLSHRYTAVRDGGAFVDGVRLTASDTTRLDSALISIDQPTFGEAAQQRNTTRLGLLEKLTAKVQRIRMLGTSAVELAWTAEGKLDACIMLANKPWDTSAGVLIAREAGVRVVDQEGHPHTLESSATIAVTPGLEIALLELLHQ